MEMIQGFDILSVQLTLLKLKNGVVIRNFGDVFIWFIRD